MSNKRLIREKYFDVYTCRLLSDLIKYVKFIKAVTFKLYLDKISMIIILMVLCWIYIIWSYNSKSITSDTSNGFDHFDCDIVLNIIFLISDKCKSNEFRCNNGRCVPRSVQNDGTNDCWDNSDETIDIGMEAVELSSYLEKSVTIFMWIYPFKINIKKT